MTVTATTNTMVLMAVMTTAGPGVRVGPSAGGGEGDHREDRHRQACQLVGDAVQGDARGRRLHPDPPAADDHPQDPHVPWAERNARADAGQDQVRGRTAPDGQALDEDGERHARDHPRNRGKRGHLDHLQEGQRTEGFEHLFVVDEPRQDHAEDDGQDAEHDGRAEERGTTARDGLGRSRGRDSRHVVDRMLPPFVAPINPSPT